MDRRAFLRVSAGSAAIAVLPLSACSTSEPLPPVEETRGPTAVSITGTRYEALPNAHEIEIDGARTGRAGRELGRFNFPVGVVVIGELAYVVEKGNHRVQILGADGVSGGSIAETVLNYPGAITAGSNNELLIADSRNARIVGFTTSGEQTRELGTGALSAPSGLAVIGDTIYVADPGLRKVVELDRRGNVKRALGGEWVLPTSLATDGDRLFVVDVSTPVIAVLDRDGRRIDAFEVGRPMSFVSYGADGMLYVS